MIENIRKLTFLYLGNNFIKFLIGKESRVNRKANWKMKYEQRELLGFNENYAQMVEDTMIAYLAGK